MRLTAHGIAADLPPGWEGAITTQREIPASDAERRLGAPRRRTGVAGEPGAALAPGESDPGAAVADVTAPPAVHLGNFPLPPERGDFGSGAVEIMLPSNAFLALVEYGPECVDTPLFERAELPRDLRPEWFDPRGLQRQLPGQAGYQTFFTYRDRAFCLYVVLGERARAATLVSDVNRVLDSIAIG